MIRVKKARWYMPDNHETEVFVRNLLTPGFPFSIRDKENKLIKVHRQINENQCASLLPTLEKAYRLCLEGKSERAATVVSEFAGLLVAADIGLGSEFMMEVQIRKSMPRMLSQIRGELRKNAPSNETPEG